MLPDVTPDQLFAAYEFMRIMPPFSSYKIPPANEVEFHIVNDHRLHGWHKKNENGLHVFAISRNSIGHTASLMLYVAHEMIHLVQAERGTNTRAAHNAEFRKIAEKVCDMHGFDFRVFV
jgi:hypothetical protein